MKNDPRDKKKVKIAGVLVVVLLVRWYKEKYSTTGLKKKKKKKGNPLENKNRKKKSTNCFRDPSISRMIPHGGVGLRKSVCGICVLAALVVIDTGSLWRLILRAII